MVLNIEGREGGRKEGWEREKEKGREGEVSVCHYVLYFEEEEKKKKKKKNEKKS